MEDRRESWRKGGAAELTFNVRSQMTELFGEESKEGRGRCHHGCQAMDVKCNHCLRCGPGNPCGHQLRFCAIKEEGCEGAVKKQKRWEGEGFEGKKVRFFCFIVYAISSSFRLLALQGWVDLSIIN